MGDLLFSQPITLYLAKVQSKISRLKITLATPGARAFAPTGD